MVMNQELIWKHDWNLARTVKNSVTLPQAASIIRAEEPVALYVTNWITLKEFASLKKSSSIRRTDIYTEDTKALTDKTVSIILEKKRKDEMELSAAVKSGADGNPVSKISQTNSAMRVENLLNKPMDLRNNSELS